VELFTHSVDIIPQSEFSSQGFHRWI